MKFSPVMRTDGMLGHSFRLSHVARSRTVIFETVSSGNWLKEGQMRVTTIWDGKFSPQTTNAEIIPVSEARVAWDELILKGFTTQG